ncbi:MAG: hypothetical protein HS116_05880 [Planctomycetes bacterium]|nr:hypothetical protein [Planctomycetota bacterium]
MQDPLEYIPPRLTDVSIVTKPRRKRRRRGEPPEPPEPTLDELAEEGRLDDLLDRLSSAEGETVSGAGKSRLIRKVLDVVSASGLDEIMEVAVAHMLRFSMVQFCKAEVACRQKIRNDEARYGDRVDLPEKVVTQDLPRMLGIQRAVCELLKTAATVRRHTRVGVECEAPVPVARRPETTATPMAMLTLGPHVGRVMIPKTPEDEERLRRCGWEKVGDEWWRSTPIAPGTISIDTFSAPPIPPPPETASPPHAPAHYNPPGCAAAG